MPDTKLLQINRNLWLNCNKSTSKYSLLVENVTFYWSELCLAYELNNLLKYELIDRDTIF